MRLGNFTQAEVEDLLLQHARDNRHIFEPDALQSIFVLTQGQPWLVNALARQLTVFLVTDLKQSIQKDDVENAKEVLIKRMDTHLDSLA